MQANGTLLEAVATERATIRELQDRVLNKPAQVHEQRLLELAAEEAEVDARLAVKSAEDQLELLDAEVQQRVAMTDGLKNETQRKAATERERRDDPAYQDGKRYLSECRTAHEAAKMAVKRAHLDVKRAEEQQRALHIALEGSIANQLAFSTPKVLFLTEVG